MISDTAVLEPPDLRSGHGVGWWDLPGAAPLHATRRDPALYSEGAQVEVIARYLGTPFLPWQSYAARIIGERRANGEYEHQVVVISVPRQSGKTTLLRAVGVHRCLVCHRDVFYTAQTGKDARARWGDLVKALELSTLHTRTLVRRAAGTERVIFPGGSVFQTFAPNAESLHGYTPPVVMLDEAFAHDKRIGDLLMGAIGPSQMTILDKQILIVSTRGTAQSEFLNEWLTKAIDGTPRVAVLDWAATDGMDPFAAETIWASHPAVGFKIGGRVLTPQDILDEAGKNSRSEYERAYLNRSTLTSSTTIPAETWRALWAEAPRPDRRKIVLTYDLTADGKAGAIVATWRYRGKPHGKVVMSAAGSSWIAGAVVDLADRWGVAEVAAHDRPPVREVTDRVERAGVTVRKVPHGDWPEATQSMLTGIETSAVSHAGDSQLTTAFAGIAVRETGDGVVFSRRLSVGDSSSAFAFTVGRWVLDHPTAKGPTEVVVRGFGS